MILLYVNGQLTDINEDSVVSLQYQLNSPNDLSSFTTVYSTSLVLPLTSNNKLIFGYPTISTASVQDYTFRIMNNSSIVDSGTLVVASVDDKSINCNLFSSLVTLDHVLTYATGEEEVTLNLADFSRHGQMYDDTGTLVDIEDKVLEFKRANFSKHGNGLAVNGSEGFIYLHPANIGCPQDFDSNLIYDGTNETSGQDLMVLSAPTNTNGAYQFRTYQLQPMIPMKVIFNNVLNNHNGGFFITMSEDVEDFIDTLGYTISKVANLSSKSEESEVKVITDSTTHQTAQTVSATKNGLGIGYTLARPTGGALHTVAFSAASGYSGYALLVHVITVSDGTSTWTEVVYPSQTYNKNFFNSHDITISGDSSYSYDEEDAGFTFWTTGLAGNPSTITVTSEMRMYRYTMHNNTVTLLSTTANTIGSFDGNVASPTTYNNYVSLVTGIGSALVPTVTLDGYLSSITNPWAIIKAVLKKFNIRIKHTKIQAGIPYYELVFTNEYYDNTTYNLLDYLDFTDSSYNDHVFNSRLLTFNEKPINSAWLSSYSDTFNLNYGHGSIKTSYPVTSSSEWFSNKINYGISPNYIFHKYGDNQTTLIPFIFEAMDKDSKEVDISGCLVSMDAVNNIDIALTDDEAGKSCYYSTAYLDTHSTQFNDIVYLTTVAHRTEQYLYNSGKRNPEGTKVASLLTSNFKDVIDSASSRLFTCGVFINKLGISVYDFVTRVYSFLNRYWVVYSMKSYNPNSKSPTIVTFLRVNDINNYIGHYVPPVPTYTLTFNGNGGYCQPNTFTGTTGQQVTVQTYPNEHYSFDTWDDGSEENPRTFTVGYESRAYTANFVLDSHVITLTATYPQGMPAPILSGGGTKSWGTTATITASDAPIGYAFDGWYLSGTRVTADYSYSFTVSGDATYEARYSAQRLIQIDTDTTGIADIYIELDGYEVQSPFYASDDSIVDVSVTFDSGYVFDRWDVTTGTYVPATADFTMAVYEDYTAKCYAKASRTITITGDAGVSEVYIELNGYEITTSTFTANDGDEVYVSPSYNTGMQFDRWNVTIGTLQPITSDFTFTVSENFTAECISTHIGPVYQVTLEADYPTGMPAPTLTGAGEYPSGTEVTITASGAIGGYAFDGWYTEGSRVTTSNSYTFTLGSVGVTYTATYITSAGGYLTLTAVPTEENPTTSIYLNNITNYPDCEYSVDYGTTWTIIPKTASAAVSFSGSLMLRGTNSSGFSTSAQKYSYFVISGANVNASGSVMSLIDGVGESTTLEGTTYCFYRLFYQCTYLITAPALPATTLARSCYQYMFNGCTSLSVAPTLSTNSIAYNYCYYRMFSGCTSLTQPPELPATDIRQSCYSGMFADCTSLATAPELPATEFHGPTCYASMFSGCTSLKGPIRISATTPYYSGTTACSSMFTGSGTSTEAGGTIYVGGNVEYWNSENAGIDSTYWTVELITEEPSDDE